MTDVVDPATRSRMMSGIKAKNTSPELLIRKALHARGFRFRIHADNLIGKPDLVLPKYKALVFIHGCFWHGHNCRYFKVPKTRPEFWLGKIESNRRRDALCEASLQEQGWRVVLIWECAVRAMKKDLGVSLIDLLVDWIEGGDNELYQIDEELLINFASKDF